METIIHTFLKERTTIHTLLLENGSQTIYGRRFEKNLIDFDENDDSNSDITIKMFMDDLNNNSQYSFIQWLDPEDRILFIQKIKAVGMINDIYRSKTISLNNFYLIMFNIKLNKNYYIHRLAYNGEHREYKIVDSRVQYRELTSMKIFQQDKNISAVKQHSLSFSQRIWYCLHRNSLDRVDLLVHDNEISRIDRAAYRGGFCPTIAKLDENYMLT